MESIQPLLLSIKDVKELLNDILEGENISEPVFSVGAGCTKGDGFSSFITRADVTGKGKDLHFIIKCAPSSEELRSHSPIRASFLREMLFYEQIHPAMIKFQEKKNIENRFNSVPKFYKSVKTNLHEVIVMENIRAIGFKLWSPQMHDDQHFKMLFTEYAKLHAISFAMKVQCKEEYYMLSKYLFDMSTPGIMNFEFFQTFSAILDGLAKLYKDDEVIQRLTYLKNNADNYFEYIINNKGKNVIITHGDCWYNNMMFRYNDTTNPNKPTDLRLIDFQHVRKGSPVLDLSYFFYASASKHPLSQLDKYLKLYYSVLDKQLQNFGLNVSKIMTFEEFMNDWNMYSNYGYLMGLVIIKDSLTESDEIIDMTDITSNPNISITDKIQQGYKNQHLMNVRYQDLTNHMHDRGFLHFQY